MAFHSCGLRVEQYKYVTFVTPAGRLLNVRASLYACVSAWGWNMPLHSELIDQNCRGFRGYLLW